MFLAQWYAPEDVSGAVLITELATDLVKRGHQVTVVTGAPNYPYGRIYPEYRNFIFSTETLDDVKVVRTWSYISPYKTFWRRILQYGTFSATSFYGGLLAGKPEIIVIYSPPLPLGLSALLLSRLWHIPWVLQLEDIYPEAAVAAGVLQNRTAIKFLSSIERFLYRQTTHISVISESFRRNLLGKGVAPEKITMIPVWADPDFVKPMPKENSFRSQNGLNGKFVLMYAGNLGHTSCLEEVLAAAEHLRTEHDICFVIIGEGIKKAALMEIAEHKGLENVIFLPYQPREVFPNILAAADLNLVTLNRSSALTSLPSKTFNIMASARPILAVTSPESEIAHLIDETECGVNIPPEAPRLLTETILRLRQQCHQLEQMGWNGRSWLEKRFSRERCVELYEHMLLRHCQNVAGIMQ